MLHITIPESELYDQKSNRFFTTKEVRISLEHSLISISKWESKWHKPFLSEKKLTDEELIDYVRCMTITQNVDKNVYYGMNVDILNQVKDYIGNPMTASIVPKLGEVSREKITSELIYYWMIKCGIPFECEKWHLNRLLTLIKVCNYKDAPKKKMSASELASRNRNLNALRRKQFNSGG